MLEPLKQWFCDVCGDIIEKPEDGYVIWQHDENRLEFDFKVIHHVKCDTKAYPLSMHLDYFLGEDGRNSLLSFLSIGTIKINLGQRTVFRVKDIDEFVDFFRRMQVPYYEEARTKFGEGELLDYFSDSNEENPYLSDTLKSIVENNYR